LGFVTVPSVSGRLDGVYARAVDEHPGRVVVVNGPPGVGKTTVARLLAARAANGVCISGDTLADFIVRRRDGDVRLGLGYESGALLAANYLDAGYELVVFEYCFERADHIERFRSAYSGAAPVSVFTLWAPLHVVCEREAQRPDRRRLGDRVRECWETMRAHLAELGEVVENDADPAEVAERLDRLASIHHV
jgi:chloramphenicol 3-O-phosphotransferase